MEDASALAHAFLAVEDRPAVLELDHRGQARPTRARRAQGPMPDSPTSSSALGQGIGATANDADAGVAGGGEGAVVKPAEANATLQ